MLSSLTIHKYKSSKIIDKKTSISNTAALRESLFGLSLSTIFCTIITIIQKTIRLRNNAMLSPLDAFVRKLKLSNLISIAINNSDNDNRILIINVTHIFLHIVAS